MKSFGGWVLFFLGVFTVISKSNSISDAAFTGHESVITMGHGGAAAVLSNRKLKERSYDISSTMKNRDLGSINQEDYPRVDPSPTSKARINSGPIEHGTPLMPYVPVTAPSPSQAWVPPLKSAPFASTPL